MITGLLHRRRLLFWLVKAYIRKRKRTIFIFFSAGITVGIIGYFLFPKFSPYLPQKTTAIGMVGAYTIDTLPSEIQNKLSMGLTRLNEKGEAIPSAALSYEVGNDGKTYTFILRDGLWWQDEKKFEARDVNYNFKDVTVNIDGPNKIIFTLKEPYAPFLTVVSQPLYRKGLVGIAGRGFFGGYGDYRVVDAKMNGLYVQELSLEKNLVGEKKERLVYKFYATDEEAKIRFMLGEIDSLVNLIDVAAFAGWKNVDINKATVYNQLVTIFFNTSLPLLSDKNVRQALNYAISYDFAGEERATSPLSKSSWAYKKQDKYTQNIDQAKKLLAGSAEATQSGQFHLTLTTTPQFKQLGERIKSDWEKIGVETEILVVNTVPSDPQILLERFRIPTDPDQYILWHSTQASNISHYSNPRIDKFLEDGRQIINGEERAQIYADFQKHLVEESPAAFLYYPTVYTISRK